MAFEALECFRGWVSRFTGFRVRVHSLGFLSGLGFWGLGFTVWVYKALGV